MLVRSALPEATVRSNVAFRFRRVERSQIDQWLCPALGKKLAAAVELVDLLEISPSSHAASGVYLFILVVKLRPTVEWVNYGQPSRRMENN